MAYSMALAKKVQEADMSSKPKGSVILGLVVLGTMVLLTGPAAARNPNLSYWTLNLSGDEPAGETWNDSINEIEVVGDTVHVTYWAQYSAAHQYRLYYRRSTDGGQSWQPKILLYETDVTTEGGIHPMNRGWKYLAVDGTTVHVAYTLYQGSPYGARLMYRRSTDNGASFEAARQLAPASDGWWWISSTRIAASQGKVTIAFQFQAYAGAVRTLGAMNSGDGGQNFTYTEVINSGHRYLSVSPDDLKRVGNKIYILYGRALEEAYDIRWNTALYCATSLDGGATFTNTIMTTPSTDPRTGGRYLTYGIQEASYSPNVALDGDYVYVIWTQNDGYYDDASTISLYLRRSTDRGLTFGAPQKLAQNQTEGIGNMRRGMETIGANGGYVYVIFMTEDGTVYLRRSADSGAGFQPLQTMGTGAWWPNLVVDPANGAKVHVFWWTTYRYSSDGGATFSNPVVVMPFVYNSGGYTGVQMALGPGDTKHFTVPLVFCTPEYGWGDEDIFYRRLGPAPAPTASNQALHTYSDNNVGRYDCMEVPGSNWLNFTSQMTGEVWVKPYPGGKTTGTTAAKKYIFCKVLNDAIPFVSGSQFGKAYTLGTYDYGDGRRQAVAEIGTTAGWFSLSAGYWNPIGLVPDDAWTHLAFTYDAGAGANNFKLYKNGQLIASMTVTGNINAGPGNFYAGAYGRWDMTELRLWNRALSQAEIQANMYRRLTGTESGLTAYWPFGQTTQDKTGHGNDGIQLYMETYVPFAISTLNAIYELLLQ